MQHESRNGTVNTATHRYQDFSFTAHNKKILNRKFTLKSLDLQCRAPDQNEGHSRPKKKASAPPGTLFFTKSLQYLYFPVLNRQILPLRLIFDMHHIYQIFSLLHLLHPADRIIIIVAL